ncbi:MAG: hypothetical protein A2513_03100 [Sulfurimonas sp. RIFOXYD12_FULL_33_39]|nr:MAG: hypothetical protein A3G74_02785 [Sulfurimonas sp. RIFCSPLOWO2_12_FULL_34_6]OHE08979.1 MAG: hypothetical protein A2513_03100 [Sulfurimonas sp. RIFOXYD12_FULL_33_39]OHE14289.1 MAG: hypothetical protein A2530_06400 [Sulfurimonas sp. RIFOXYD2_FULL_34_21]
MMKKILLYLSLIGILSTSSFAEDTKAMDVYNQMQSLLKGEWSLSEEKKQIDTTDAYKDKAIVHLVGTDATAIAYKVIGRGATFQEDLLPNTKKEMVTMYHCNNFHDCTELKATHYCAKQNQPQFILNSKETTENKIVFDCDMKTKLCNSDEDHVHQIIHEISENGKHLKSSYLGWKNQKPNKKHSIYHFDKK